MAGRVPYVKRPASGPGPKPGRTAPTPGNAWADRFYYPMPAQDWSSDDSVITDDTADRMREAWDNLADWAKQYALERQEVRMGGHPPICPDCKGSVITYPFAAIESYQGVRHTWCEYPEREKASA